MTYSEVEREIDAVEKEMIDAVSTKDAAALDRIISDDFVITGETLVETLADKKLYLADCLGTGQVEGGSASNDRLKLLVYENTAIVNSKLKQSKRKFFMEAFIQHTSMDGLKFMGNMIVSRKLGLRISILLFRWKKISLAG